MSKRTLKIIISVILAIFTFCSMTVSVFGADSSDNTVTPRWNSIENVEVIMGFDVSVNEGCASGTAMKQTNAYLIEGYVTVYKQVGSDWEYICEWYGYEEVGTLAIGGYFDAVSGVMYKAVFTVYAYTYGIPEAFTCEYSERCP